jgi:hypothetical protein
MERVLRSLGLFSAEVQGELAAGRWYWREERRLCSLMLQRPSVPPEGHGDQCSFSLADVLETSRRKSFDYRRGARRSDRCCLGGGNKARVKPKQHCRQDNGQGEE